ncbi:ABC-2 transporter permease [Oceanobacillus kimchii]|uniref:ABC-2 transporter permease n=1 Tax=Oceanobacillus kimchii TaxID=746691 RepID=UPI000346D508|nr:ABC-2 transporter permease [Oceanobacillus kimchii]
MFNLIKRDLILQKKLIILYMLISIGFIMLDKHHPAFIFLISSIFIPFNTHAYDEKTETNLLLNSLPYTRKQIIAARYIGAVVYMLLAMGWTSIGFIIFGKSFTLTDIVIGIGLFLTFVAFAYPLFYIFKPGYITIVIIISFLVLSALLPFISTLLSKHATFLMQLTEIMLYIFGAMFTILVYLLSWGISHWIYQRKAF